MRQLNGLEVFFQASEPLEYTFDTLLETPAIFKTITSSASGDVKVKFANGVDLIIDCNKLDALNAQVVKVYETGTDLAITDFELFR